MLLRPKGTTKCALSVNLSAAKFCGQQLPSIKHATFCGPQLQVSNMRYLLKFGDALRPKSTKYALSVKVRRSFVAHNSHYETCVVVRSLAMLLLPKSTRYTLSVKVRRSFVAHNSSVKLALLAEVWRRFCGPDVPNMRYR